MDFVLYGAVGVVGIFGFATYSAYNRLMALDERCKSAFADIDVLLKHRHTLIPGLLETTKGFLDNEREMMGSILNAQIKAIKASNMEMRIQAETQLGNNITSFISKAETMPELKASEHFVHFRNQLVDVENRVTASRRFYNLAVSELNSTVRQLPGSLIASTARVGTRKPFDLSIERVLMDEPVAINF